MPQKGHDYFSGRERAGHLPVKYNTAPQGKDTDTVARSLLGRGGAANLQQTDDLTYSSPSHVLETEKATDLCVGQSVLLVSRAPKAVCYTCSHAPLSYRPWFLPWSSKTASGAQSAGRPTLFCTSLDEPELHYGDGSSL